MKFSSILTSLLLATTTVACTSLDEPATGASEAGLVEFAFETPIEAFTSAGVVVGTTTVSSFIVYDDAGAFDGIQNDIEGVEVRPGYRARIIKDGGLNGDVAVDVSNLAGNCVARTKLRVVGGTTRIEGGLMRCK
jgi:hypothetical protein